MAYGELSLTSTKIEKYLKAPESVRQLVQASNSKLSVRLSEYSEKEEALIHKSIAPECVDQTMEILASFASHLQRMHRMKVFRLQLFILLDQIHTNNTGLIPMIISTLLEDLPRSLARLTIDCYSGYRVSQGRPVESECLSSLLLDKSFIPSLRHLCLRSRFICPRIFDPFCSSAESRLESLIINTSLRVERSSPPMNKVFFSKQCHGEHVGDGSGELCTKLKDAAKAKLPQLARIKVIRLLRHKHPSDDVLSYDVLSDRTVILPENANWEDAHCHDDGKADPDCEELSENSFSSSDLDNDSG